MSHLTDYLATHYDRRKILILGWGREGQSSYRVLSECCPAASISVSDQNEQVITDWATEHRKQLTTSPYLQSLDQYDVIFKAPGIPVRTPELLAFQASGKVITNQLNEFLHVYRDRIYGVTGTKGKSTTSSLVTHFLFAMGKRAVLAGNIGTPVFEIDDYIVEETNLVIEMSSYQLETTTVSPHVAVFLNLFPEHLNYHQGIENYIAAKAHITSAQSVDDYFIYNQDSPEATAVAAQTQATKIPFSYTTLLEYPEHVNAVLAELDNNTHLPATIKSWNVLPALLAVQHLGFDPKTILRSLTTFTALPHRLEKVGVFRDVTWIDDTLATIPEATIAALEALPRVDVLMLGGFDRGISYEKIVHACMEHNVSALAFFKTSGEKMYDFLKASYPEKNWPAMKVVENMEDAVRFAYEHAPKGGTVLLSPSSPSFGEYKDYRDKSAKYRDWIMKLEYS